MTEVSAVVISHGHSGELATLLPILAPQVDELVVVANRPGSLPTELPTGVRVVENAVPRRLAENVNLGVAATSGAWVLFSNPDVVPDPDAVGILHAFAETRERCGIAGPRTVWPDRGSRRAGASRPCAARSCGGRPCAGSSRRSSGNETTTT